MRQWIEEQLQNEYQAKLRIEGAILALEGMLKKLDNNGQQAADQPQDPGPADVQQPQAGEGPEAIEDAHLDAIAAATIDDIDHD